MSSPGDDKDLEDLLAGRSDLSRRYRASNAVDSQAGPPAELDRAILAQARAAVAAPAATVSPLPVRKRIRWAVPFALAASVLLTFAIFREGSQNAGVNGNVSTGVVTEQSVAPLSAPAVDATAPGPAQENEERAAPEAVARDEVAQKSVQLQSRAPVAAASAPAAATPAPAAEVTTTAAAPTVRENLAVTSGAVAPAPPPAAAPAVPATSAAVAARAPAARASAELARAEADAAKEERTPESWLEDVRKLRAAGEGAAADEELQRFLAAYPDYFTKNPAVARP